MKNVDSLELFRLIQFENNINCTFTHYAFVCVSFQLRYFFLKLSIVDMSPMKKTLIITPFVGAAYQDLEISLGKAIELKM